VILPEFFTSGMAFHPEMADATRAVDGPPAQLLLRLAREGNAVVGGSFLAWRGGNVYNTFVLALPDGSVLQHDKDLPSFWENCYYIGGEDDGILVTPAGNVGVSLCWEFIRSGTAARLRDRVGMVVGGSCWWTEPDTVPMESSRRKLTLDILKATPSKFARMLGVPVVHASHAGSFSGGSWPDNPDEPYSSHYLGETQIVDGRGEILARMSREDGEGFIVADVTVGTVPGEREPIPKDFWLADYPEGAFRRWESQLKSGHEYYLSNTQPHLSERFLGSSRSDLGR
jgi:predicted amidohydrolase